MALHEQAFRKASMEKLVGQAKTNRIAQLLDNPTDEMLATAKTETEYRTYQQALGKWARKGESLRTIPGGRWIVPFYRIAVNLTKYGLERTPLAFGRIGYKAAKKQLSGGELDEAM